MSFGAGATAGRNNAVNSPGLSADGSGAGVGAATRGGAAGGGTTGATITGGGTGGGAEGCTSVRTGGGVDAGPRGAGGGASGDAALGTGAAAGAGTAAVREGGDAGACGCAGGIGAPPLAGSSASWKSRVNSPGCGAGTTSGLREDETVPTVNVVVGFGPGGGSSASMTGRGPLSGALASSHSGNVVNPERNSLTTANPFAAIVTSRIRARSATGSAMICSRSRSAASGSAPSRMCTMTGRPVDASWALCVRTPPPSATHLSRR